MSPSTGNVHSPWARLGAAAVLLACVCLDFFFVSDLARSPRLGAALRSSGGAVLLESIEPGSPLALAGLKPGDTVLAVEGMPADPRAFVSDRNLSASWADRDLFDSWQAFLLASCADGRLSLALRHAGRDQSIDAPVERLGQTRAWLRSWAIRLVGWAFLLVSWRIWRLKKGETAWINFLGGIIVFLALNSLAAASFQDFAWDPRNPPLLLAILFLATLSPLLTLHIGLVFPEPFVWLSRRTWLRALPWMLYLLTAVLDLLHTFGGPVPTRVVVPALALGGLVALLLLRLFLTRNATQYRQLQWVVLGTAVGFLPWILLCSLPLSLGLPALPQETALLFTVATPLCLAFAVLRYRLLDIGPILDGAAIHAATIALLSLVEIAAWNRIGERISPAGQPLALTGSLALLLFLYAPIRQFLSNKAAIRLGRNLPPVAEAQQWLLQETRRLGSPWNALEVTLERALPVQAILWWEAGTDAALDAALHDSPSGALGVELGEPCPPHLTGALWIPLERPHGHAALALLPRRPQGWSRPDLRLALALVRSAEPLGEIESLRWEHASKEQAFEGQRSSVLREMHDGLGSQLFGLSMLTQVGANASSETLRHRLTKISEGLADAQNTLRTGLATMAAPPGAFGPGLMGLLLRAETLLDAASIRFRPEISDEVATLTLDSRHVFSLLRCVQEALVNVVRHAGCGTATLRAHVAGDRLHLEIQDDGTGFDLGKAASGHGLANIRQRCTAMEAVADWSFPGKGTRLTLEIPLRQKEQDPT